MKRLILVRHGKSSWELPVEDRKRPLKKRAFEDAKLVVDHFLESHKKPDILWSSPAVRAVETAKVFKEKLGIRDENFLVKPELYTFTMADLLKEIKQADPEIGQLMLFGHNPAITALVNSYGDRYFDNIPTTGLTLIEFETNHWKDIKNGKTVLNLFPKNLR